MKRVFNKIVIMLTSMIFYMILAGAVTELTIATGLAISSIVTAIFDGIVIQRILSPKDIIRIIYAVEYLLRFIVVEIAGHIKVTKIIMSRRMSVNPAVVWIPLELKSDYAISAIALTITNTPGTIAVDFDRGKGVLYVHWLIAKRKSTAEIKKEIVGRFEELAKKVFD
ncbi:MAG: Na+/H+ antiporter subunit E [Sulfolobales archaeon]